MSTMNTLNHICSEHLTQYLRKQPVLNLHEKQLHNLDTCPTCRQPLKPQDIIKCFDTLGNLEASNYVLKQIIMTQVKTTLQQQTTTATAPATDETLHDIIKELEKLTVDQLSTYPFIHFIAQTNTTIAAILKLITN